MIKITFLKTFRPCFIYNKEKYITNENNLTILKRILHLPFKLEFIGYSNADASRIIDTLRSDNEEVVIYESYSKEYINTFKKTRRVLPKHIIAEFREKDLLLNSNDNNMILGLKNKRKNKIEE